MAPVDEPGSVLEQFGAVQMFTALFTHTADVTCLTEAVETARVIVRAVPSGHEQREGMLLGLSTTLRLGYQWLGEISDLTEAETALRGAIATDSPTAPWRNAALVELCRVQRLLYTETGDPNPLDEAIDLARSGLGATTLNQEDQARLRLELGHALLSDHERTGDMAQLREALDVAQKLGSENSAGGSDFPSGLCLHAEALGAQFRRTGDLPTLRQAVDAARDAIAASNPPHLHRAAHEILLVDLLCLLAESIGDQALAHEAVRLGGEALKSLEPGDPQRASGLSSLSRAYVYLAGLSDDREMMLKGARSAQESLKATPYRHTRYVARLTDLIGALMSIYRRSARREFLDRAVHAARNAVASTPADHPERARVLSNLCIVWEAAAKAGITGLDLSSAVKFARNALVSTPPDHPDRATLMMNLADVLTLQDAQTGESNSLTAALSAYSNVARMESVSPTARVVAAQRAASLNLRNGRRHQAMAMIETAVGLVPHIALRDVDRASREHRFRVTHGLAATAAATAIAVGDPARAVELLEQTRGLVLAGTLDTRSDITELRALAPDLVEPFNELRRTVNLLDHESTEIADLLPSAQRAARQRGLEGRRAELNSKWEQLLDSIRSRNGLEFFLQPQPMGKLRAQAANGPIIYITVHEERGYALVLANDPDQPVRLLELPSGATAPAVDEQVAKLREARADAADRLIRRRKMAQRHILEVLDWTWHAIAEPVLRGLGHATDVSEMNSWPRVWWCPVGLTGFLPLHAAGCHCPGGRGDAVMDRVISSYTPTVRALAHLRQRDSEGACSSVVVAVPDAPECPPLNAADREARAVRDLVPGAAVLPWNGTRTSHESVINALRSHHLAHLACHAVADWTDPSSSRLILHDHLVKPLKLHDLTRLDLQFAQLAYLSACSTTENNPMQVDEATQLTAAFQLAGYRHVIGTLWPIADDAAEEIARAFYRELTSEGTAQPTPDRAAEAIHRAIRLQRDQSPHLPTRWAAHVHYGV
ncbi:CHAT domain-containing protein [Streptomyces parvus]|uniref:CHAT domain-containing protein n=1 Tax=Streptomyces parvus TaxID=66428 RepID=A0A5D4JIY7_9ACTN|nr:CHAT domain-containing protein [Streptomyces parvus]TYR64285.1 CHAT domain-containing protein [Streptomyces parvus]